MIHVVREVRLEVPLPVAWKWLSNLEGLLLVNMLHREARFENELRRGVGTTAIVPHGLWVGPKMPRRVRVTHWEEFRCIGWVDLDLKYPKYTFPHSQQFRLEAVGEKATVLTNELRGSLNFPIGAVGSIVDRFLQKTVTSFLIDQECKLIKGQIERLYLLKPEQDIRLKA
jgi:hypothetical protein